MRPKAAPKLLLASTTTKSHAIASEKPAPNALPCTAATTGRRPPLSRCTLRWPVLIALRICKAGTDRSPRSPPALKRSEEHTSELQSLMRISYAVFCLKKKKQEKYRNNNTTQTHTPNE